MPCLAVKVKLMATEIKEGTSACGRKLAAGAVRDRGSREPIDAKDP